LSNIGQQEIALIPGAAINKAQRSKTISTRERSIEKKIAGSHDNAIHIAFTFYVIAIAAKLARADSAANTTTTAAEIASFKEIFSIPESDVEKVAESYNEAVHDGVSATHYARQLVNLFPNNRPLLAELVDDLLALADAFSPITPAKVIFLRNVVFALNFNEDFFKIALRKHIIDTTPNPFALLDVAEDVSYVELKKQYRNHVKDWHPDKFASGNVPVELVEISREQFEIYTKAYDVIKIERGFGR